MTNAQIQQLVAAIVSKAVVANATKPAKVGKADMLASKDKSIVRGFAKKGIKDVVLMDRTDPSKDFDVRPYKGWLANGRQVRKGQTSVKGLFHISQTDAV